MRHLIAALILLVTAGVALPTQAEAEQQVRGWTILSDSDAGADAVIAAAGSHKINHLQLSHEIVHDLREVREPAKQAQANRLTKAAHDAGIAEVAIWDHSLYDLDYYPAEFRTGPDGTIDLDDPAFWEWFKQDYREMLDLVPDIDSVVLTFIETGARVERQHSAKLTTAEQKLAYLVDRVAEVIVSERGLDLYLRTFGYFPEEMERTIGAIALVSNPDVKVMAKATPHDFFLTHPNDSTISRINRPVLIEYDTAGEYNGQGKIANAWPEEHIKRLRHYQTLPNVIGYVARTDRYDESRIVGTPTEINLYALARATEDPRVSVETIYREFAEKTYGRRAAGDVAAALSKSYEIVTSVLYSLGTNTANHSRLDYEPYCSSYHRSVSGKWIEPPVTYVRHGVNKRFHFWIDVVNHLSPAACKTDPTLAREAQYVLDRGWVTPGDQMTPTYLRYVLTEKDHGVRVAESALRDIDKARRDLSPQHYQQLKAYFERTVLTARLHRAVAAAYFGYRIYARDAAQRTGKMRRLIWDGLDDAQRIAEQIQTYPAPAASGEWDWVRDAAEAAKYHDRISKGWDRYGGIAVPRP
ncbi:hypothetical protein ITP53_14900 [Nonomuraea sp. K274]|uniref:Uncharacterized protein n=1 Tax=Nonomuraea cypriaca TaxID=1187855 RepID=A0A931A608_9ACTN|nr:hypothetical protein [Nonomuraea cypriaca]MBF8187001.1 hypothetical protein [Nonomuraea cypriaca]